MAQIIPNLVEYISFEDFLLKKYKLIFAFVDCNINLSSPIKIKQGNEEIADCVNKWNESFLKGH